VETSKSRELSCNYISQQIGSEVRQGKQVRDYDSRSDREGRESKQDLADSRFVLPGVQCITSAFEINGPCTTCDRVLQHSNPDGGFATGSKVIIMYRV
jgi:hypothetical protein